MEESALLKERFQAITEKHHIQELVRLKKRELDQEKLKLQHLKKKTLREQWLLQDSGSHNATDSRKQQSPLCDQQQTRVLQLKIHSIETEILSLERDESMISTNESLILSRLKAVEKSPQEKIKEAHVSFVPESLHVTTLSPESQSSSASNHTVPEAPRKALFDMKINVSKNSATGERAVLSPSTLPPEEFSVHTRNQAFDDDRKCVYAMNSQQGSHDLSCISNLSAAEVKLLLRSATVHRQINQHQNQAEHHYAHQEDTGHYGNYHNSRSEGHYFGNHKGERLHHDNQMNGHYLSSLVGTCHSVQEDCVSHQRTNSFFRGDRRGNGGVPSGCPPPHLHHLEVVRAYQPQLGDYIDVDEAEWSCNSSAPQTENSLSLPTALYHSPTSFDRVHSPLYRDDTPYTILNTLDTTEPITAIFMGFQAAQDDSGQGGEFGGSLKAELVIIEDEKQNGEDNNVNKKSHATTGVKSYLTSSAAAGKQRCVQGLGDRRTETQTAAGTDEERRTESESQPI